MDRFKTQIKKEMKAECILKLRTAHPYGLNDKINENYKTFKEKLIGTKFSTLFPALHYAYNMLKIIESIVKFMT